MKVLFLLPYPIGQAPSQRFRVEMLLHLLERRGIEYALRPFLDRKSWKMMYLRHAGFYKIVGIMSGFLRRIRHIVVEAPEYDFIFIHREASPFGPPLFEWYLSKVLRKPVIYDFDDAIWMTDTVSKNWLFLKLKCFWKVPYICSISRNISAGNKFLFEFASKHSSKGVSLIPTVVDTTARYHFSKEHITGKKPVVGWTGSRTTLPFLDPIIPIIRKLQDEVSFTFLVIADQDPQYDLIDYRFMPWDSETEIQDLLAMDIGIMPLPEHRWTAGKCGFKLIQYLSLGIPALASDVGVNSSILESGKSGYLCKTSDDWYHQLKVLLLNAETRSEMGLQGKRKIQNDYSIKAVEKDFLALFH